MAMVEVFKTDVQDPVSARKLTEQMRQLFPGFNVNFDLADCDHILRVQSATHSVIPDDFILLLRESGFEAEVLPDTLPAISSSVLELEACLQNV